MRADRLVAALLILQARGRVTAAQLAEELEVSERTARRDMEALGMAGVPVYSQPGRGGGWSLIGGARTDLSGLTADEARMLFLVAGPSSQATPEVKAALRKLVQALPETFRAQARAAASAIIVDPATWDRTPPTPPRHLDELQQAIVGGVQVRLGYDTPGRGRSERMVHPLGLVAKGAVWYLIAGTDDGQRTFRVSRVRSVELTDLPLTRPEGFDLAEAWSEVMATLDERRTPVTARVLAGPPALGWLRGAFGTRVEIGDPASKGTQEVVIRGHSNESLAAELASFGTHVEVLAPKKVRDLLARLGAELTELYGPG